MSLRKVVVFTCVCALALGGCARSAGRETMSSDDYHYRPVDPFKNQVEGERLVGQYVSDETPSDGSDLSCLRNRYGPPAVSFLLPVDLSGQYVRFELDTRSAFSYLVFPTETDLGRLVVLSAKHLTKGSEETSSGVLRAVAVGDERTPSRTDSSTAVSHYADKARVDEDGLRVPAYLWRTADGGAFIVLAYVEMPSSQRDEISQDYAYTYWPASSVATMTEDEFARLGNR